MDILKDMESLGNCEKLTVIEGLEKRGAIVLNFKPWSDEWVCISS